VIHDPAGLFGTPHSTACGYPYAFVSFPVVFLSDVDICISWPDDFYLVADIVPDGLHGVFSYTVPDGYTATPASSTNGETYVSADYPSWWYSYGELTVTFLAPSNCLTTIGTLSDTADISNCDVLDLYIEPVNDPGYYLGADQTNTYRAVLNMSTPGTYQWSVDTNHLQIVGSETASNVVVTAVAPGQTYLELDFTPEGSEDSGYASYEINALEVEVIADSGTDAPKDKRFIVATFPPTFQDTHPWTVFLYPKLDADAVLKYQRLDGTETVIPWNGTQVDVKWVADPNVISDYSQLNYDIECLDGSEATPHIQLVNGVLQITSVQHGDRIIIEELQTGCRDIAAVVKNFSWNDLQRLGANNLTMHPDYAAFPSSFKANVIDTIKFCLNPNAGAPQAIQREALELDPDVAAAGLCTLDIPSARGVGVYRDDMSHLHLGAFSTIPASVLSDVTMYDDLIASKAQEHDLLQLLDASSMDFRVSALQFIDEVYTNMVSVLSSAWDITDADVVFHTYEVAYSSGALEEPTTDDPIRHIHTQKNGIPSLFYAPLSGYPNGFNHANYLGLDFVINKRGEVILLPSYMIGATHTTLNQCVMIGDALNEF